VNTLAAIGWVDLTLLTVLALSAVVGLWRGLVFELMALVGWVVAYIAAQAASPLLAAHLPLGLPGSALRQLAAFALVFLAVLIAWTILARLVRLLVHATPLTLIDRVLGAGFGLLRGAVLLLLVSTVVAFTPAARSQPWQDSQGAAWLGVALQGLKPVLPDEVLRHLPA
jgi:membrane protein required for colicin V production